MSVARKEAVPEMTCPTPLGVGVKTKTAFCDVMTGSDPAGGILITLPPHKGPLTLTFNLHNRHTYSEEEVRSNRGYRRYTATIGVLTMDNNLISRAVVQNEFRTAADLIDRVGGGAGPGGVKAVAPTGSELISITIPEGPLQVSVLGEKLTMERLDGSATYAQPDRPIADISNVLIEYPAWSAAADAGKASKIAGLRAQAQGGGTAVVMTAARVSPKVPHGRPQRFRPAVPIVVKAARNVGADIFRPRCRWRNSAGAGLIRDCQPVVRVVAASKIKNGCRLPGSPVDCNV